MKTRKSTYVLTPRRLAANLRNLERAWVAPRRPYPPTPRQIAASRANARKAAEANRWSYKLTPRRLAANLANLAKGRAAAEAQGHRRTRAANLKHGLYGRSLEQTMSLLGETPKQLEAHRRLVERTFAPQDELERKVVQHLADAIWSRLVLYRAQARWEAMTFKRLLATAPRFKSLTTEQTRARASAILRLFLSQDPLFQWNEKALRGIERQVRALLRKRTGGDPQFRLFTHETRTELKGFEKMEAESKMWDLLESGDPRALAIARKIVPEGWKR